MDKIEKRYRWGVTIIVVVVVSVLSALLSEWLKG